MKRLSVVLVVALVVGVVALPGCGSGGKTYTEKDTNITAKVGSQFVIELQSNQTAGYQWGVSGSFDSTVVKKISSKYVPGKNSQKQVGVGGVENWTFEAAGKGSTKIVMVYMQPFDKQAAPAQTVTFDVTVD